VNNRHYRSIAIRNLLPGLAVVLLFGAEAGAQSPPPWPTPAPTASETPTPVAAAPTEPAATPTAVISQTPSGDDAQAEAADAEGGQQESAAAEVPPIEHAEAPKSEQVTNPGGVAFTDYEPFDLEEITAEPVKTKWGNFVASVRGLTRYSLFDDTLKFRIGGRAQFDATSGSGDTTFDETYGPIETDVSLRRLGLYAAGRYRKFNFNLGIDVGPDGGLSDAWVEGAEGGLEVWGAYLGKLRLGFMDEPFSLERQTSTYNIGFMERSLPVQTMAPGSNLGWMVHNSGRNGRFSWAFGMFSFGQKNEQNATTSALSLTGRFTHLLTYRNEGRNLVHLGVSLSSRSPTSGDLQYRSRPEARFVDFLADTGNFEAGKVTLWGLEFATVQGPLWAAAEYIQSNVSAQSFGDPRFGGSYIQVGWFLTGENRPYRTNSGTFERLRPDRKYAKGNPFKKKNGGAWEVVGRISTIDLTDGLIEGGELTDYSASLNWYINPTSRVEFNYVYANPRDHGAAHVFLMRLQYSPW
jgi:phosphate-selective porin OprO/OprP